MAQRQGFGNVRLLAVSGSQRNAIVNIRQSSEGARYIDSVVYSYGLAAGVAATFVQGRLVIGLGTFSDDAAEIAPDAFDFSTFSGTRGGSDFSTLLDMTLSKANDVVDLGRQGILIPPQRDVFVLLTAPLTSGDVQPAFDSMLISLTVNGRDPQGMNPYGKLR